MVESLDKNYDNIQVFSFQPLISNHLPSNFKANYEANCQYKNQEKRQLIITNNYVELSDELNYKETKALSLCHHFIQNNQFKTQVDFQQIENMIEQEFIQMDELIEKMKID